MEVKPGATDEETALKGIEAMEDFYRSIGMPTSIHELGVDPTEEQIKIMAHNAIIASGGKRGSARVLYEDDFVDTYTALSEKHVFSSGKQIYVQNAKDSNVRVYSILGNVVADKKADSNLFDLNIPVPGIYLVKVDSEIWKVVVE